MKKVILYGGAFNPPTIAHECIVAACIAEAEKIDAEVWLMPSGNRPDKTIEISDEKRYAILRAFTESFPGKLRLEECELRSESIVETYITRDYLHKTYPECRFIWVFGSDSILTMKQWGDGASLWHELDMLLINRPGYVCEDTPPKATIMNVETPMVSSTMVREKISAGKRVSNLVPRSIRHLL